MSAYDLVVRNGTLVSHNQCVSADLGISGGRIAAIGSDLEPGNEEVDAYGLHVLPGLVDAHVHMREPGMTEKGGFSDGTRAAAAGGVTTVIDMPNTKPPVTDADVFTAKRDLVESKAHVDFALYGLLTGNNADKFTGLAAAGCVGLKLYLGKSVGDNPVPDDGAVFAGLQAASDAGLVVGVHAENDHLVELFTERVKQDERDDPASHSDARPEIAEVEAITRIITLSDAAGAELHIHHLSTGAGLDVIRRARANGSRLTVEVVIAHLLLDNSAYAEHGNLVKLNPPLRRAHDREELWRGIRSGEIDILATDHAPHTAAEQCATSVWDAQGGFIGVETFLPLLLEEVAAGRITIMDVVRLCSYMPAERWGLESKGRLSLGADADLVFVDLNGSGQVQGRRLNSAASMTPFEGRRTRGVVRQTYLRGTLIAADGVPLGSPRGRLLSPHKTVARPSGVLQ